MANVAHPCRKRDWEPNRRHDPEYYFDALSDEEKSAVNKLFPRRTDWADYEEKHRQLMDIPPAILDEAMMAHGLEVFEDIYVFENAKANPDATAFIGMRSGRWFQIAAFGDQEYLEKVREEAKNSDLGWLPVLIFTISAVIALMPIAFIAAGIIKQKHAAQNEAEQAPRSELISEAIPVEPEYFLYNLVTEKTFRLEERFPNLRSGEYRIEVEKQRRGIIYIYSPDGVIYAAKIMKRELAPDGKTPTKFYMYDSFSTMSLF